MNFDAQKARLMVARQELSLDQLSKRADMPLITLSQVLRGKRKPTLKTLGKIARGLGVDVTEILAEETH